MKTGRLAQWALDAALPITWSHGNPVDIIGDAPPERYSAAMAALLADPGVDAVLALNCPIALVRPEAQAEAVMSAMGSASDLAQRPVFVVWAGERPELRRQDPVLRHHP